MRSPRTLVVGALLGVVVVLAAGSQGAARFTGLRWVPDWRPNAPPPPSRPPQPSQVPPPTASPPAAQSTGGSLDLTQILLWVAVGIAALLAAVLLWRWLTRRPPRSTAGLRAVGPLGTAPPPEPEPAPEPEPEPEPPVLRRDLVAERIT
ncbi:hypothetical protein [Pseudonocardia nigra]|uniref:hypothetical protein n=1 Tax=Pseudonocardia nigra TaxID=1921578 RepID=UPI001C5FFE70|nr:hypothetical protein [Pseudonocardia nigra]